MFLFIFESIGTQELILIAIVALVFLGPRKLPEYMRKAGKMMNDFRATTNEFKETWEREVNFEEESKALSLDNIDDESKKPIARAAANTEPAKPLIKEADPEQIERMKELAFGKEQVAADQVTGEEAEKDEASDKGAWL